MSPAWRIFGCAALGVCLVGPAWGGPKTKLAREAAEYVVRKFGKEAAKEGVETLSYKIETLAVRHGEEVFEAVKKVGPRTFRLVEEARDHGGPVVKLMARHGDDAVWVVCQEKRLALFVRFGDTAADAMIKHGELAEPVLEAFAKPAASALNAVSSRSARRIAMMHDAGELSGTGRGPELLQLIGKYGDRAADFIWNNRQALQNSVALATFLSTPESHLDGTEPVAEVGAHYFDQPLTDTPAAVVAEPVIGTSVKILLIASFAVVGLLVSWKVLVRREDTRKQ
jgi:hypothetical protein